MQNSKSTCCTNNEVFNFAYLTPSALNICLFTIKVTKVILRLIGNDLNRLEIGIKTKNHHKTITNYILIVGEFPCY